MPGRIVIGMKLYFSPLACSMATRIALYEAGAEATYIEVDPKTKQTRDGVDYRSIHSLGLVPALSLDDGTLITENAAVLQYVAGRFAEARLGSDEPLGRARLQQWLCFIGTELHRGIFAPLLDKKAPDVVKEYALAKADSRLSWVDECLRGRETVLDRFTVVDGYLFTVVTWATVLPQLGIAKWEHIDAFMRGMRARPHVARAFAEERELYMRELARNG